jgi:MFS family permease
MIKIALMNFLLSVSTSVGMSILPIICTESLGLSIFLAGLIEGATEFLSNVLKILNGYIFDKIKNKKILFIVSNAFALISKILLFFISPFSVFLSKIVERASNGLFAVPRDAFVSNISNKKGSSFSYLAMSKCAGCVLGPFFVGLSTLYFGGLNQNIYLFIELCVLMTFVSFLLSFSLPSFEKYNDIPSQSINIVAHSKSTIFPIVSLSFIFFLARFNDGLLLIFLKASGFPEWFFLSTIGIFNASMFFIAPVFGATIDKNNTKKALFFTFLSMTLFSVSFLALPIFPWFFSCLGLILWGIQRSGSQIVFLSLISKNTQKNKIGFSIGLFYVTSGLANLIGASVCGTFAMYTFNLVFIWSLFWSCLALIFIKKGMKYIQF